ncbi:MAG: imidazolonepropionase [Sporolactobacillus laevolacticus]|jgi:imidazolonepropionase|nr:imidazolonepropionase [Sporolactobacillus laevolacticus]
MKMSKLIIKHAAEIATPIGRDAVFGEQMNHLKVIKDGAIVIENGVIVAVGSTAEIVQNYDETHYKVLDATGKSIVPGFVDSHTHFLFGGYRPEEFFMRLSGKSYMEIMNAGGGIQNTVNATRASSFDELYQSGRSRLDSMLSFGITTVEGKSGYGLDYETEIKQLEVMRQLNEDHPVDVVSTFLGAHAVPTEYEGRSSEYIDFIITKVLPTIIEKNLAEFCDVFCEEGVISVELSRRLLLAAKELGMKLKIHADEIEQIGGAELAAELNTVSADHLLEASEQGIRKIAQSKTIATLLPATAFCLNKPYASARTMIDEGCAVALASDNNPGSCFTDSIPLLFALACINMKMSAEEALTALTLNGAAAVCRANEIGSIEEGKLADLVILKYPSYQYLVYNTMVNIVDQIVKKGELINPSH